MKDVEKQIEEVMELVEDVQKFLLDAVHASTPKELNDAHRFIDKSKEKLRAKLRALLSSAQGVEQAAPQAVQAAVPFMWAIQKPDGTAYMNENCVSTNKDNVLEEVDELNSGMDAEDGLFKVVPVYLAATQPAARGLDALTPAARDVLAERKRQIESEGWKTERDDVYDTGEMALAAACYAAHSASCAAIKAPHTVPGVFVRTRSAQDFVGEMWPWSDDWWKPSGHRRNLEKAGALVLAEIERIDRAALAAQAKQGGA